LKHLRQQEQRRQIEEQQPGVESDGAVTLARPMGSRTSSTLLTARLPTDMQARGFSIAPALLQEPDQSNR
jgi:hypothetical protein